MRDYVSQASGHAIPVDGFIKPVMVTLDQVIQIMVKVQEVTGQPCGEQKVDNGVGSFKVGARRLEWNGTTASVWVEAPFESLDHAVAALINKEL